MRRIDVDFNRLNINDDRTEERYYFDRDGGFVDAPRDGESVILVEGELEITGMLRHRSDGWWYAVLDLSTVHHRKPDPADLG